MTIHVLQAAPPAELARALARFEAGFTYPLGPGRFFRISHGDDYPRFYRAMGEATCFVAERHGEVVGVLAAVIREVVGPDGRSIPTVYLGDLKIAAEARGGRLLPQLAREVVRWVEGRVAAAFAVVMDGTPVTPNRYTGRLGIPPFCELGRVVVLRLPTEGPGRVAQVVSPEQGMACFANLTGGRYVVGSGEPRERSETQPTWLIADQGQSCGRLEDTLRAKRLIADDTGEMRSAHLSYFAYRDVGNAATLLGEARQLAASRRFPALFVAVPSSDAAAIVHATGCAEAVLAPATVYGAGLEPGIPWVVNTAEI